MPCSDVGTHHSMLSRHQTSRMPQACLLLCDLRLCVLHNWQETLLDTGVQCTCTSQVDGGAAQGNVAFACAGDGWAFTLPQFAEIYATKMGANPKALQKVIRYLHLSTALLRELCAFSLSASVSARLILQHSWCSHETRLLRICANRNACCQGVHRHCLLLHSVHPNVHELTASRSWSVFSCVLRDLSIRSQTM